MSDMNKQNYMARNLSLRSLLARVAIAVSLLMALPALTVEVAAQRGPKFDPQRFERELEAYVVEKAGLTAQEKEKFLPVYREMRAKQRAVFDKASFRHKPNFDSEEECEEMIRQHDNNEIRLKRIQRTYHNKFLTFMPAKKVIKVIGAEDEFHRIALKKVGMKGRRR